MYYINEIEDSGMCGMTDLALCRCQGKGRRCRWLTPARVQGRPLAQRSPVQDCRAGRSAEGGPSGGHRGALCLGKKPKNGLRCRAAEPPRTCLGSCPPPVPAAASPRTCQSPPSLQPPALPTDLAHLSTTDWLPEYRGCPAHIRL